MERPLAILFVDIADSTRLYETLGNVKAAELTRRTLFLLRSLVESHRGGVIKLLGDGVLAAFPDATDAATAALAMLAAAVELPLKLRVGMSYGLVVQQSEDVYGDACNVAARVQSMARPGEALATEFLVDGLSAAFRVRAKPLNRVSLKGKTDPIMIYELRGDGADDGATVDATTIGAVPAAGAGRRMTLTVGYRGRNYIVNRMQARLTAGRDEGCDIRISSRQSSRHHAQLDFSRESFIVTDQSTNGTFIRAGGALPLALRRDSTKLVGSGLIGFGAEPDDPSQDHVVAYRCDVE